MPLLRTNYLISLGKYAWITDALRPVYASSNLVLKFMIYYLGLLVYGTITYYVFVKYKESLKNLLLTLKPQTGLRCGKFGFELSVVESVSSHKNISVPCKTDCLMKIVF